MAIEINDNELQEIQALQDEFLAYQRLEVGITSDRGLTQQAINDRVTVPSFYADPAKVQRLIDDLNVALKKYIGRAGKQGRLLAEKSMTKFLDDSARRKSTLRQKRLIREATTRQAERRLAVFERQMTFEGQALQNEIRAFIDNGRIAGMGTKEILKDLVDISKSGSTPGTLVINGKNFDKRFKSVATAAARREKSLAEISAYREQVGPEVDWQWITVSAKPCPDCEGRAGVVLPYSRWEELGIPGAGRTICTRFCLCKLIPVPIAEKRFPTVKVFDWNFNDGVLTTASEARILTAQKNMGANIGKPQKT